MGRLQDVGVHVQYDHVLQSCTPRSLPHTNTQREPRRERLVNKCCVKENPGTREVSYLCQAGVNSNEVRHRCAKNGTCEMKLDGVHTGQVYLHCFSH